MSESTGADLALPNKPNFIILIIIKNNLVHKNKSFIISYIEILWRKLWN